jgi:hypothetical protein
VAQRELAGEARQQHQPQADDAVDEHEGQLRQPVFGQQPGRGQQGSAAGRTRTLAAVLGQADVLA